MRLIHLNILGTFGRYLIYTMAGAMILWTLVDMFDHMGSFLDNHASLSMFGRYYMYKAAWIIDTVLPIAMLMATLFTVGSMARYNELTALFASGRSLMQITRPLLMVAVLAAGFSLAWREYILPAANTARSRVWDVEIHKRPERLRPTQDIAVTGEDGRLYYARKFNPVSGEVRGLRVLTTADAQVTERIDADRAVWSGKHWLLQDVTRRSFAGDTETAESLNEYEATELSLTPETLYQERIQPEDMNIRQLRRHSRLIRSSGGDATESAVDLQFMLAFPAVHLIVVFMGILLASGHRKTTIASGFGLTVLISFCYYLLVNFGRSLGHSGTLSPPLAGWGGNALYLLICWGLFLRARR